MSHSRHTTPHIGDDVNNTATGFDHALVVDFTGEQEPADQIGTDHGFKAFLIDGGQWRRVLTTRIVQQSLYRTMFPDNRCNGGLNRFFLANVTDEVVGAATIFGNFSLHAL